MGMVTLEHASQTGYQIRPQGPYDREIDRLTDELLVWVDALKGPVCQLREDVLNAKGTTAALHALEIATARYDEALRHLLDVAAQAGVTS